MGTNMFLTNRVLWLTFPCSPEILSQISEKKKPMNGFWEISVTDQQTKRQDFSPISKNPKYTTYTLFNTPIMSTGEKTAL